MSNKVTLGGDRLGSGNRMKQELHNYFRSNHNLGVTRISSMSPGVLYPMYVHPGLVGDTFDIDLNAFVRTLPTEGPMFGAFKLQVDVFSADVRNYQAILHNNTTDIGMDMNQVLLPKVELQTQAVKLDNGKWKEQMSKTCLLYYLGIAGVGRGEGNVGGAVKRKFNAVPMLAYYDIFKNYYANKQEENAYVITSGASSQSVTETSDIMAVIYQINGQTNIYTNVGPTESVQETGITIPIGDYLIISGENLMIGDKVNVNLEAYTGDTAGEILSLQDAIDQGMFLLDNTSNTNQIKLEVINADFPLVLTYAGISVWYKIISATNTINVETGRGSIRLQEFPLKNIDLMRKRLLTYWDLGEEIVIDQNEGLLPYNANTKVIPGSGINYIEDFANQTISSQPMQGLVVKCYQSDMFNNWLDNEWVNKINQRSQVSVTNGSFSLDALNMAKKLYNYYNRIAISGNTYDDWKKATYGMNSYSSTEKPVYHGGMSSEVIFDEVVSQTATAEQPLGSLGGRGALKGSRGGHVIVKCKNECFIMIMVSLTPRLSYSQGNAWYMTELDSMDDFHKPEFDRIGFQDLMTEQLAWWDTQINLTTGALTRSSVGKQPSWIQYMTDVNKVYGDFAEPDGKGFMVLQRLYDQDTETGGVADVTTYIEPTKYNYAFAVDSLTAQNFWTFLDINVKARRLMSAKQIPNL